MIVAEELVLVLCWWGEAVGNQWCYCALHLGSKGFFLYC